MALTWQQAFKGKVGQEAYNQAFALEGTLRRITCKAVTQTFEFEGLDEAEAKKTDSVTVTDVGGTSYTFMPKCSFTDSSTGTMVFPTDQVRVTRSHMSPHLWRVTVQRTGTRYYLNGVVIPGFEGPQWAIDTGEF